jgi:hypothetical protein
MDSLVDYLENYLKPTLEQLSDLLEQGDISDLAYEKIVSGLLDTVDEFDEESNYIISTLFKKHIN